MRKLLFFCALNFFFASAYAMQHESDEASRLLVSRTQTQMFEELCSIIDGGDFDSFKQALFEKDPEQNVYLFDVNKVDGNGGTLLMYAISNEKSAFVSAILSRQDLDINKKDSKGNGNTALHYAVQMNNWHIINQLLQDYRLDLTVKNKLNQAASFYASNNEIKNLLKDRTKVSGSCCCNMV